MGQAVLVVLCCATAAVGLSWAYFRRYAISRPPIGVFNHWDVAIMIGGIVLVPYLYLALPRWLVAGLLAVGALSALYFVCAAVVRVRWAVWLLTLSLAAADLAAAQTFGSASATFFAINNAILVLVVIAIGNLWAQSGMRSRDLACLAALLAIYDATVTWLIGQTDALFQRLVGLPFAPIIAWPGGAGGMWLGVGMGDLLLAAAFPLVMRKAFGRAAGSTALVICLGVIGILLGLPALGITHGTFPVMVALGPLMLVQHMYWWRRRGVERTMRQYWQAEPLLFKGAYEQH